MKSPKNETWGYLFLKHMDFLISLVVTGLIYFLSFITTTEIQGNYVLFSSLFMGVFTINFTVFAISKYLMNNYEHLRLRLKEDINAIFRTPMNLSVIGLILSIFHILLGKEVVGIITPFVIFLLIYAVISSYLVFTFIYNLTTSKKG